MGNVNQGNMMTPPGAPSGKLWKDIATGVPGAQAEEPNDFAVSGSPDKLNSKGGVDDGSDRDAAAALSEFRGVGRTERISSMPNDGSKADIDVSAEMYQSPANLEVGSTGRKSK